MASPVSAHPPSQVIQQGRGPPTVSVFACDLSSLGCSLVLTSSLSRFLPTELVRRREWCPVAASLPRGTFNLLRNDVSAHIPPVVGGALHLLSCVGSHRPPSIAPLCRDAEWCCNCCIEGPCTFLYVVYCTVSTGAWLDTAAVCNCAKDAGPSRLRYSRRGLERLQARTCRT